MSGEWVAELRRLAGAGLDIVQIAEYMREHHAEFQERSLVTLNEYRLAFDLSVRQMQDIGGWYDGGLTSEYLRSVIPL
ncbi:hypothetical protein AB0B12_15250 [Streptomyces sp. NPDC044780]|uniref:hypothetical protein n=1 Tax=unclassified Streptomyces TaxID=2593676 RepID=UPI0033D1F1CB